MDEILSSVIAVVGAGTGILAIALVVIKVWITRTFNKVMAEREERDAYKRNEYEIQEKMRRAQGRLLYWIVRGIKLYVKKYPEHMFWGDEVDEAHEEYLSSEDELKALQRKELSRLHTKK